MFKVRVRLVGFVGDQEKYPCHMQHKVGDEVTFDGERYEGRLCPDVWPLIAPKVSALHQAGPRYVDPPYYYPFWYAPPSVDDESKRVYDGLGFRPVLSTHVELPYHMANLAPANAFKWPPAPVGTVMKDVAVICPDPRTSALFMLEAFDLAEKGFDIPFFRRQMAILDRVQRRHGIGEDRILHEFTRAEQDEIYPPLCPEIMTILIDELALMGYLDRSAGSVSITEKGRAKLEEFRGSLSEEERAALRL
jgi:uncharacterized repeat protein (TIGR04076 family)